MLASFVPPGVAHADPAATAAAAAGIDWKFWGGVFVAALTLLSMAMHRSHNAKIVALTADLDKALALIEELGGKPVAVTSPPTLTAVKPASGTAAMLAVLLLGGLVALQPGCAASQRESTIKAAMVTVDASRSAYLTYDQHAQADIVAKATSLDDGKAKLEAYRMNREKLVKALTVAYQAIATAAQLNDEPSIAGMQKAIGDVLAIAHTLTGGGK